MYNRWVAFQASLRDAAPFCKPIPGTKVPGYFHGSLWDPGSIRSFADISSYPNARFVFGEFVRGQI